MNDLSQRLGAALGDRYRLERDLGEGGMATVYLAEDLKHRRKVALKVLRPELAAVVGAERFLAEIEVTANLQHPHVLPLFDSGEADSFLYYVMPFVEGESLRARLDRERQLPVDEALRIAKAVASALDYAHRQGVVHRDIKPANILVQDGEPLLADFGIALAIQQAGGGRLTETGLSLGTPYYMSPEQATAERDPGPRSDVYSLGCVLYEMLTGEPPFTGTSAQAVLGRILTAEAPNATNLRKTVPPHVDAVIRRALEKVPADRFGSAAEFARALDDPAFLPGPVPARSRTSEAREPEGTGVAGGRARWAPWGVAAGAVLALLWSLAGDFGTQGAGTSSTTPTIRATLELPPNASVTAANLEISRDGGLVVVTGTWDGRPVLLGRRMDELDVFPIPGSEGANHHFLSPDAEWVAFRRGSAMWKLPLTTGPGELVDPDGRWAGGDWTEDGTIFYNRSYVSGLWRIPAEGGTPEQLTEPAGGELAHWWPQLLPDGEHVLFTAFQTPVEDARLAVLSLASGTRTDVYRGGVHGRYVPTGHLLFARGEALYAVPFDLDRLEVTGDATPVVDDVAMTHTDGVAAYGISDTGTLVYVPASDYNAPADLVWVDRDGVEELALPEPGRYSNPALSPDGRSVALAVTEGGQASDVWILDLVRGTRQRITSGGGADFQPVWTPRGDRLIYVSERPVFDLYQRSADASAPSSPLRTDAFDKHPGGFTPDGDTLLYEFHGDAAVEGWKIPLGGGDPEPVYTPEFDVLFPTLSPDGRWLAYASDESDGSQIYLSPYADPGSSRRQVSIAGGTEPRWTRNGRELVYREANRFLAVSVDGTTGELGRPEILFEGSYAYAGDDTRNYDVTADGERLLIVRRPPERAPRRIVVVTGFFDKLRALGNGG